MSKQQFIVGPQHLANFNSSFLPAIESYNRSIDSVRKSVLPIISSLEAMQLKFLTDISPTINALNTYSKYLDMSFSGVIKQQERLWEQISPVVDMLQRHQEFFKSIQKKHQDIYINYASSLGSIFAETNLRNIDFSGLDSLSLDDDLTDFDDNRNSTVAGAIASKKTLKEMNEDDLSRLINKSMDAAKKFSVAAFIYSLYSEYVNDAARVILEVVFAFLLTTITGHYNTDVKSEIIDRIQEAKVVTDTRKVITRYVKANPVDQVAFLRKEGFLREGTSKKSPIVTNGKISTKTVLTIVERKNNWLKVEIDSGDFSGEFGWIEESKVIKFKRIK